MKPNHKKIRCLCLTYTRTLVWHCRIQTFFKLFSTFVCEIEWLEFKMICPSTKKNSHKLWDQTTTSMYTMKCRRLLGWSGCLHRIKTLLCDSDWLCPLPLMTFLQCPRCIELKATILRSTNIFLYFKRKKSEYLRTLGRQSMAPRC